MSEGCKTCGFPGGLPDKHVEFSHSAIGVLHEEIRKRDKIVKALRDIIASQRKSQQILELRREVGQLMARNAQLLRAVEETDARMTASEVASR